MARLGLGVERMEKYGAAVRRGYSKVMEALDGDLRLGLEDKERALELACSEISERIILAREDEEVILSLGGAHRRYKRETADEPEPVA